MGAKPRLAKNDTRFSEWEADDLIVQSWLLNSVTPDTSASFAPFHFAQEVWEAARDVFALLKNQAATLEIEGALQDMKKSTQNVT